MNLVYQFANACTSSVRTIMIARPNNHQATGDDNCRAASDSALSVSSDQLLIFTKGCQTYTPHQIGIKRMPCSLTDVLAQQHMRNFDDDNDEVDYVVDMHGHIIGMNLSPDHRFVFVGEGGGEE